MLPFWKNSELFTMTKDKYDRKSGYRWKEFSRKELDYKERMAHGILVDLIHINDIFYATNEFINYDNSKKDNYFRAEARLLGVKKLFTLGIINNPDHQAVLEDLVYKMMNKLRRSPFSTEEKAYKISEALKAKILTLK